MQRIVLIGPQGQGFTETVRRKGMQTHSGKSFLDNLADFRGAGIWLFGKTRPYVSVAPNNI